MSSWSSRTEVSVQMHWGGKGMFWIKKQWEMICMLMRYLSPTWQHFQISTVAYLYVQFKTFFKFSVFLKLYPKTGTRCPQMCVHEWTGSPANWRDVELWLCGTYFSPEIPTTYSFLLYIFTTSGPTHDTFSFVVIFYWRHYESAHFSDFVKRKINIVILRCFDRFLQLLLIQFPESLQHVQLWATFTQHCYISETDIVHFTQYIRLTAAGEWFLLILLC